MTGLPHAKGFRDLIVYQKARLLAQEVYRLSASFPREAMYSLTDQTRRAARSIGANIAEAWAERRYEKHFVAKLTDADGEQQETQHWVGVAVDCGYWTEEVGRSLPEKCEEIGRLLAGMIAKAGLFCGDVPKSLREPSAEYFVLAATDD